MVSNIISDNLNKVSNHRHFSTEPQFLYSKHFRFIKKKLQVKLSALRNFSWTATG